MAEGEKPSDERVGRSGAYSYHRPRRLARISRRAAVSRDWNLAGSGDGGGRKGWYRFCCGGGGLEGMMVAEMGLKWVLGLSLEGERVFGRGTDIVEESIIVKRWSLAGEGS